MKKFLLIMKILELVCYTVSLVLIVVSLNKFTSLTQTDINGIIIVIFLFFIAYIINAMTNLSNLIK